MARTLRVLAVLMGVACALIGIYHFTLGIASVPGETHAGATVDSRERFFSAIFLGYGLAWVHVARLRPVPARAVRRLTAIFLLGGLGRVLSLAVHGVPHWFQVAEGLVELVLPFVFFALSGADEAATRRPSRTPGAGGSATVGG